MRKYLTKAQSQNDCPAPARGKPCPPAQAYERRVTPFAGRGRGAETAGRAGLALLAVLAGGMAGGGGMTPTMRTLHIAYLDNYLKGKELLF